MGGDNLQAFTSNRVLDRIDRFGLTSTGSPWSNIRRKRDDCGCSLNEVNKVGCKASSVAYQKSINWPNPYPSDKYIIASRPEYCGYVCCNAKDKNIPQVE
jgi:hypothetical protein